jgi:hypothetical protein
MVNWSSRKLMKEWRLANGPFVVMPIANNSGVFAIGIATLFINGTKD